MYYGIRNCYICGISNQIFDLKICSSCGLKICIHCKIVIINAIEGNESIRCHNCIFNNQNLLKEKEDCCTCF